MPYEKIGKNDPVCIADEVPFEIPDSWEWVRLGSVCTKLVDGDHNPPKGIDMKTSFIMASSTNINNDSLVELEKVRYLPESVFLKENERTNATPGDILFTSVGSLGRSCIYDGSLNICFQRSVSVMTTLLYNHYLKSFFDSGYFQSKIIKEATGTAQKGFYLNQLAASLIPVPPMEEQRRIVAEIQKYSPYIIEYEAKKHALDELTASFPELLKRSILQQAVMGKLVPQDPNDEPASALLKKIRDEKEALIKAGKLKKDKHESIIYRRDNSHYEKIDDIERCIDEDLPFEIPSSWEWVRLGSICEIARGGSPRPIKAFITNRPDGINWIKIGDTDKGGKYINSTKERIIAEGVNKSRFVHAGDFLLTNSMSFGRPYILNIDGCIHDGWLVISNYQTIYNKDFLYYMLSSTFAYYQFCDVVSGAVVKNLNSDKVAASLFPVPPMIEQKRIVARISELMPHCDEL